MFSSDRARVTIAATEVFAIAFLVAAFGLVRVVDNRVHEAASSTTRTAIEGLVNQVVNNTPLERVRPSVSIPLYFQVFYANGARAGNLDGDPILTMTSGQSDRKMPGNGGYVRFERTIRTPQGAVFARIFVASSLDNAVRGVDTLKRSLYLATPILIAMVAWMAWVVVGRAFRPVAAIREEVTTISSTTIDRRVPVPDTDDEVARLATTMNAMLDRLESAQLRQREFVSDASHELRSPLASMRAELEVAIAHPDRAEWLEVAARMVVERDRLERLVDDLLQLARLDEGAALRRATVDLDDIVLSESLHARPKPVMTSAVSAGRVIGDHTALEQLVRNLLDNAARFATTKVSVELTQIETSGEVVLRVDDDGPGVPVEERTRIFERFARSDAGRGRGIGGAGLGLALVERVTRAHHGSVRCDTSPLGGARFEVRLPGAP